MLDKKKIYCFGSDEFAKVAKELLDNGIIVPGQNCSNILNYIEVPKISFAYSTNHLNPGNWIGYALEDPLYYNKAGYQEVTPQQFRDAWIPSFKGLQLSPQKPLKIVL